VGGSSLVVWDHSTLEDQAVRLVQFLTSPQVQAEYTQRQGILPAKKDVLANLDASDPFYTGFLKSMEQGKVFPLAKLAGLVEDQLAVALSRIWNTILAEPGQDPETVVKQTLAPLARRYNNMMSI
jgi:ABC-type glycerol-3-phosphate transport system substrate-binding protein